MTHEIQENLDLCDEILDRFSKLSDSDSNEQNTWLLISDLETRTLGLKQLYEQVIEYK